MVRLRLCYPFNEAAPPLHNRFNFGTFKRALIHLAQSRFSGSCQSPAPFNDIA
ncbi:hypothetical protein Mchl_3327 [Methylorubrum extorquens CM4]|jgi:hypothetical protein|uniref:Uncharacterized protein n=1 Tax=Methylorubrum extorquens (strain CM4 / NCIMB 13688) TaxID=440085 RepID=B7KTV2_METC4|nr:hypothetical protein Mchl_3327 [Methylorubrum extorquens CM4]